MSWVLRHVNFGEGAAIVKVGGGAGNEEFGFGGGIAALLGGQFGEGQGRVAAGGVRGDSLCRCCRRLFG